MDPTPETEGGSGLYEALQAERAEYGDASGLLRKKRLEQEAERKAEWKEKKLAEKKKEKQEQDKSQTWTLSPDQHKQISSLFGEEGVEQLKKLWIGGQAAGNQSAVLSKPLAVKEERKNAHQLVRELFDGKLVTEATERDQEGSKVTVIRVTWGHQSSNRSQRDQRDQVSAHSDAPPYIHFLLQKTNRDSQDALHVLARALGLVRPGRNGGGKAVSDLAVAGTKDKRGITVQRVSLRRGRRSLDDVWRAINGVGGRGRAKQKKPRSLLDAVLERGERGIRIAHLKYASQPFFLGDLEGNEFCIVLRSVKVQSEAVVDAAVDVLRTKGFINYYGMQRFGTSSISTHTVGVALLQGDYRRAIQLIMAPREGDAEQTTEARQAYASSHFRESLSLFPHNNVPERAILQRMLADSHQFTSGKDPAEHQGVDWRKYFSALPRTLRTMYVHAYQSYVWNCLATARIRRFGSDKPIIGDYVLLSQNAEQPLKEHPVDIDSEVEESDIEQEPSQYKKKVKVLKTQEDVDQYSIHDIAIPLPGSDVVFSDSSSWMAQLYKETLAQDDLEPDDIAKRGSSSPDLVLRGDYRSLFHLPRNVEYQLVRYTDPDVNLLQSDEDRILQLDSPPSPAAQASENSSLALILRFTLGVSAYATMALREVLKQETSTAHQRQLTAKGEDRLTSTLQATD